MKFVFSLGVILCGWLGSKHQLTCGLAWTGACRLHVHSSWNVSRHDDPPSSPHLHLDCTGQCLGGQGWVSVSQVHACPAVWGVSHCRVLLTHLHQMEVTERGLAKVTTKGIIRLSLLFMFLHLTSLLCSLGFDMFVKCACDSVRACVCETRACVRVAVSCMRTCSQLCVWKRGPVT